MRELPLSRWPASPLLSLTSAPQGAPEASIERRLSLRRPERAWKSSLGLVLQSLLVRADEAGGEDRTNHGDDKRGDSDGPCVMLKGAAEQVAARAKDRGPDDSARSIVEKKLFPIVAIDAGEERRKGAQHGNEAAEKDDLPAVLKE